MSETFMVGARLPAVSAEFIKVLEDTYPAPLLNPGFDRDHVLWKAAQHEVVLWIKNHAASVPDGITPDALQRAAVRYGR